MAITLKQAKNLTWRDELYHVADRDSKGQPKIWRVNALKAKTWKSKRNAHRVEVPVKHGMYSYDRLTQDDLHLVCLTAEEALTEGKKLAESQ